MSLRAHIGRAPSPPPPRRRRPSRRLFPLPSLAAVLPLAFALLAVTARAEEPPMPDRPTPTAPPAASAELSATATYTLRFPAPQTHRVEVEATIPTGGGEPLELMMAVWTPGSYLVREFARQVETISAEAPGGGALALDKTSKNRWRVRAEDGGSLPEAVVLRYRLYAREMSVRTNFVDAGFAILNGAATFVVPLTGGAPAPGPYRVSLELPEAWPRAVSALPRDGGAFVAADYDTLVDSPIYAGDPVVQSFEVARRPAASPATGDDDGASAEIVLVHEGGGDVWDYERSRRDVAVIVRAHRELWGHLPFDRYVVFNLITEGRGGLEHLDSTVLMTSRWKARGEEGWRGWLGLVSHELFHAWNGKRLRPRALGPFDYENEVYTPSLWFVEGVTSYYDDLLVHRAGLITAEQFLEDLGETIERVQTTPGRRVQPLDESSWDAWIKHYRGDENSVNRNVSYYAKGALVAWLLDVRMRRATDGEASLDDLLRDAWDRWSGETGFTQAEIVERVAGLAGDGTAAWLARTLESTEELDYAPALEWLGLELAEKDTEGGGGDGASGDGRTRDGEEDDDEAPAPRGRAGGDADEPSAAWLGAETEVREGRLVVTGIRRGTPAWDAGVNVEDELLAVDDYRVPPRELDERLKLYRPGDDATLLVARRERLLRLPVTFGEEPAKAWYPRPAADEDPQQAAHRRAWLSGRS